MSKRKKNIDEFFSAYETHFNNGLSTDHVTKEEMSQFFEECFVESSPAGVICVNNDEQFIEKIQSGFEFYKSIGSKSMTIVSKDITLLDDLHALVRIYWRYSYVSDEREGTIDFTNYYFVTTRDQVKIFGYIAGDEQKTLGDKGLIANSMSNEE